MQKSFWVRFYRKVYKTASCWLWTGSKTPEGYGRISVHGRATYAHRVIMGLFDKSQDQKCVVMHLCDNPSCVRPKHLRISSQGENIRQRDKKNIWYVSKIIPDVLLEKRSLGWTQAELAKFFNCTQSRICQKLKQLAV